MEKKQFRAIFLYEFKLGSKAVETSRKINEAFGQGTTNERIVQRWFQKFRNEESRRRTRIGVEDQRGLAEAAIDAQLKWIHEKPLEG